MVPGENHIPPAKAGPEISESPAVMSKSLVGFGHPVCIVLLLDRATSVICGIQQLRSQLLDHGLLASLARIADEPAQTQRGLTIPINFHRHLVIGAADAPRLHFQRGLQIVQSFLENLQRVVLGPFPD